MSVQTRCRTRTTGPVVGTLAQTHLIEAGVGPACHCPGENDIRRGRLQEHIEWHLRVGSLLVGLAVGILSVIGLWRKLRRR